MMAPRAEQQNGYIYVPSLSGSKELFKLKLGGIQRHGYGGNSHCGMGGCEKGR